MTQRIRIKDIATKAGVSPGTVDRVLHERGNVSARSKAKVMEALNAMDYSPNVLASVLAYNKNWKVAALIPKEDKDPFWQQPKAGILKALKVVKDYGLTVEFFQFFENDLKDFKHKATAILDGHFDAVILSPIFKQESLAFLVECEKRQINFVQINTHLENEFEHHLCYIGQDSYHSGLLGAKILSLSLQPQDKVAIVHLEELIFNSQHLIDKEKGFKAFFASQNQKNIEVITGHFQNPYHKEGLYQFFKDLLKNNPEIKGIFISTSRAFHAVEAIKRLKREDLRLVGFDLIDNNVKLLQKGEIDFLINQNPYKQGYLAIINIFNCLIRKIRPLRLQYLPLDVVMQENVSYYTDPQVDEIPIVL